MLVTGALALPSGELLAEGGGADYAVREAPSPPDADGRRAPRFQTRFSPPARWFSTIPWRYNGTNAPPLFVNTSYAIAQLQRAFDAWSAVCGVSYVYEGETSTAPNHTLEEGGVELPDLENVVGWGDLGPGAGGVTYNWWLRTPEGMRYIDSDIIIDPGTFSSSLLQAVAKHEFGHVLGLLHSDREGMLMSGPPLSSYGPTSELRYDDIRGCRCLYGASPGTPAGYGCSWASSVDLGGVPVGATSGPRSLTLRNDGSAPLTLGERSISSDEVLSDAGCAPGTSLEPGASCTLNLSVVPTAAGVRSGTVMLFASDGPYIVDVRFEGMERTGASVADLVEYFHAGFAHYFVTALPNEIAILDGGTLPGWSRTGKTMHVWLSPQPPSSPACRFFSTRFDPKSSHFYTASPAECADVKGNADWRFEGEVFHVALPDAQGTCPAGTQPIYRLYNRGAGGAPNHRFTTDAAVRSSMLAQGWQAEGAGLGVTMCAP
jgi:hypothetical protein